MPHTLRSTGFNRFRCTLLVGLAALGSALRPAVATVFPLGQGWEAVVPDGDPATALAPVAGLDLSVRLDLSFSTLATSEVLFRQVLSDASTATTLRVREVIQNATAHDWTEYELDVLAAGQAYLPIGSAVYAPPFTVVDFVDDFGFPPGSGKGTGVRLSGGVLHPGQTLSILQGGSRGSSGMPIAVDLAGEAPVEFTLRQLAIPEPAMIGLALGAALLVIGRRWFFSR